MIKYEEELIKVLKQSEKEAINLKHNFIGTEHFLIGALSQDNEISNILKKEINKESFINKTNKYIRKDKSISIPTYTPLLKKIILESTSKNEITLRNVILNILKNSDGIAITILNNQKVNINKLINKFSNDKALKYGINLNEKVKSKKYIPIVGRAKELNELIESLCKKDKNNAILIGEAGVGKTAIVEALAYKINKNEVPKEVLVSEDFDVNLLEETINTKFIVPKKGIKKKILDMAYSNAKISLEEEFELIIRDDKRTFGANEELGKLINIPNLRRIETFDNAHLFGTFTVSGMVVFTNGKPDKKEYRKYKITSGSKDDYHTMKEVIYRRYYRVLHDNLKRPDLIIVDGGISQIHAAKEVLDSLYLSIPVLGLKKNDKHSTTALISEDKEYNIDKTSDVFHLLTRIQDEVHRYTITYHRNIRSKASLSSIIDNVPNIGEVRKKTLLKKYKTITKLKSLTEDELSKDLPRNVARELAQFLKNYDTNNKEEN